MKKKTINKEMLLNIIAEAKNELKEKKEKTIFDIYRVHINNAKNKIVRNLEYGDAMIILRFVQEKTRQNLGLNMNCGSCMLNLLEIFASLEGK